LPTTLLTPRISADELESDNEPNDDQSETSTDSDEEQQIDPYLHMRHMLDHVGDIDTAPAPDDGLEPSPLLFWR
jgi:hypothetical protein